MLSMLRNHTTCVCVCVCMCVCVDACVCVWSPTVLHSFVPCMSIWMNLSVVLQIPLTFLLFQTTVLLRVVTALWSGWCQGWDEKGWRPKRGCNGYPGHLVSNFLPGKGWPGLYYCCLPHSSAQGQREMGVEDGCCRKHGWEPVTSRGKDEQLLTDNQRRRLGMVS